MLGRGNGQVGGRVPQMTTRRCSLFWKPLWDLLLTGAPQHRLLTQRQGRPGSLLILRLRLRVMRLLRQCLVGFSWPRRAPALGKGASGLLMLPNCPLFSAPPQPLLSSIQKASPGHPGHSHLALTISLKLGQLQGDLGILAACRNERKVSPAGVAHKGSDQVFGVEYGAMPQEGTKPVWEGGGGRDQVSKGLSMGALSPLWSRHKVPQAGLSDFGPGPCSRQCCDNHLYHLRTRPCAGEGKTGCAGTQT